MSTTTLGMSPSPAPKLRRPASVRVTPAVWPNDPSVKGVRISAARTSVFVTAGRIREVADALHDAADGMGA